MPSRPVDRGGFCFRISDRGIGDRGVCSLGICARGCNSLGCCRAGDATGSCGSRRSCHDGTCRRVAGRTTRLCTGSGATRLWLSLRRTTLRGVFGRTTLHRTTLRRAGRCRTLRTRRRLTPGRSCRTTRRSTSAGWARDVGLRLTLRRLTLRWLSLRRRGFGRRGFGRRVLSSRVLSSRVLSWLPLRLTRRLGSALPRRRLAATSLIGNRLRRSLTVTLCRSYRRSRSHRRSGRSLTLGRTRGVGSPTRRLLSRRAARRLRCLGRRSCLGSFGSAVRWSCRFRGLRPRRSSCLLRLRWRRT